MSLAFTRDASLWEWMRLEFGIAQAPSIQPKGMCQYAGGAGRGSVQGDGACADGENGGWGEDDLEAMIVLVITYVVKVGALVCLPVVDKRLGGVVVECYDITSDADWAEVCIDGTDSCRNRYHSGTEA